MGSVGAGTGYQALSILTRGLRWPLCNNNNFDEMFRVIAKGVLKGSISCSWEIPERAGDQAVRAGMINVKYTTEQGNVMMAHAVDGPEHCSLGGWYLDDPDSPKAIVSCPQTCDVLRDDENGRLEVIFGCDTVIR